MQFLELHQRLLEVALRNDVPDSISWRWCSSGCYSTSLTYQALFTSQSSVLGAKELWKSRALNKCHFFMWLVLHGKCWTSNRLFKHGLQSYMDHMLYCQGPDDLDHLILTCPYSYEVWFKLLRCSGLQQLSLMLDEVFAVFWTTSRKLVPKAHYKAFESLVILATWCLWLECNARVFSSSSLSASSLITSIWD
jgi:hypothetical protein